MPKRTSSKRKKHPLHRRILKNLFQRGNMAFYFLLLVAIGLGAFMLSTPKFERSEVEPPPQNSCLDFDPPNQSVSISCNGNTYYLIKKEGGISDSKMNEMAEIAGCSGIYQMTSTDYFGQPSNPDVVYELKSQKDGYHYFDIYIKAGVAIPDSIRNSQSIGGGGSQQVIVDDSSAFPPNGFNVSNIQGLTISINHPAYIYTGNKTTLVAIQALPGLQKIGTLTYDSKTMDVYYHNDTAYLVDGTDAYEYMPTDTPVNFEPNTGSKNSLQAKKLTIKTVSVNPICWYTPECKPAIYLYPEKKTEVSVRISPQGYITYSLPEYKKGWDVTAYPDGKIISDGTNYPYLYYESAIEDSKIDVPKKGYVVSFDKLNNLYNELLPKLGLRGKEITDFIEYWDKVLPKSTYYFVGFLPTKNIDLIENMSIDPNPSKTIRVRLYFEALDNYKEVEPPVIPNVNRPDDGFLVVEWGGLVKTDKDHPFTCSQ